MKAAAIKRITDVNGTIRATVEREGLRHPTPIWVNVRSALTVREARALARAITAACDDHQKWRKANP